ncbi:MAG: hypothetical protein KIH62_002205 [Candidatus Kerfeldbacteria bacterium]|nr:hypothetical protein [Candidatus Kerfeldbacteria bacterium]
MNSKTKKIDRLEQLFIKSSKKPEFIAEVKRLRKKWKISPNGIKGNKRGLKWQQNLNIQSDDYLKSSEFQLAGQKIKKILKNIEAGNSINIVEDRRIAQELEDQLNQQIPINNFYNDIRTLQRLGNLSYAYEETTKRYVLYNVIDSIKTPSVGVRVNLRDPYKREIFINLYPETAQEDIIAIWDQVKFHQRNAIYGKVKKTVKDNPQLKRDLRVLALSERGLSTEEIIETIQKEFGEGLIYTEIADIRYRMKKK